MATKHKNPCHGCTERNEICHTKAYGCERWAEYEARHQAELAERAARFERDIDYASYKSDRRTKKLQRMNRP